MDYQNLKKSLASYFGAFALNSIMPRTIREATAKFFISIAILLLVASLLSLQVTIPQTHRLYGFTFLTLGMAFIFFALNAFYRSVYFKDISLILPESHLNKTDPSGSFLLAEVLDASSEKDLVKGLFYSPPGKILSMRLGIAEETLKGYLGARIAFVSAESLKVGLTGALSPFAEYVLAIYKSDAGLKDFLFSCGIQEKELVGAAGWIVSIDEKSKRKGRFWGRDNLGRIQGIGKDWAHGQIYDLEKYGDRIEETYDLSSRGVSRGRQSEVGEIEAVLARSQEANAILVGDDEVGKMDLVIALAKEILSGTVLSPLEHKTIVVLDTNSLIAANATKSRFEGELIRVLNQAAKAGHIILVIADFPSFIVSARSLGSDVASLMGSYLSSPLIQVIAMSDTGNFHSLIEVNSALMSVFEKISIVGDDQESLLEILEDRAEILESQYKVFFTFGAILSIAESAERYFIGQIFFDKAMDLMIELAPLALRKGERIISKKDVLDLVTTKTGIPTGEVGMKERDKLVNLEAVLHQRIIGQDEAIISISSALRRARSGVESAGRPLGSFLFLGPTGVGKTETTKALAEVFFGNENKILRLDMSEYNAEDSLGRLIGSFEGGKTGVLTSLLRENPYGVLLLDEFEKADKEVHDLFLQILDEGIFSDMMGKKVNARNLIIIATSNAGSDIIWETMKRGEKLYKNKDKIIDAIISTGVFRPELLNRFDGVILFHPLEEADLKLVTRLMLARLQTRLAAKSVELVITDDLVNYLVSIGSDPKFGARPINRAIQDHVENLIAEKLIKGEVSPGEKIMLTSKELGVTKTT